MGAPEELDDEENTDKEEEDDDVGGALIWMSVLACKRTLISSAGFVAREAKAPLMSAAKSFTGTPTSTAEGSEMVEREEIDEVDRTALMGL